MNLEKPDQHYNPYQTPETALYEETTEQGELLDEPNSLPAGSGLDWLKEAWAIFMARPLLWVGFNLFYVVAVIVLSFVPIIGMFVGLVGTFVLAGMAYVAYQIDIGEPVGFDGFFMGFAHNVFQQFLLILINFVALVVLGIVVFMGIGLSVSTTGGSDGGLMVSMLIGLVGLFFYIPLVMCMWLAPILILFHDVPAFAAMKLSFKACVKNILPFLVLGILLLLASLVAMIPIGLGLLILMPVMMITAYTAYKQILTSN